MAISMQVLNPIVSVSSELCCCMPLQLVVLLLLQAEHPLYLQACGVRSSLTVLSSQSRPVLLGLYSSFSTVIALQQRKVLAATVPADAGCCCKCLSQTRPPSTAGGALYYGGPVCAFWSWVGGEAAATGWALWLSALQCS